MAATRDLAYLRARTRELADMVTSAPTDAFVDDTSLDRAVNAAVKRLYDKLIITRGDSYYEVRDEQSTVVDQVLYDLPSDFYQLLSVMAGATLTEWHNLPRYELHERARLYSLDRAGTIYDLHYRLEATKIEVVPRPPTAAWKIQISYIPAHVDMVLPTDTFDGVNGWEDWACYTAAVDLLNREESDPSGLLAQRQIIDMQIDKLAGDRDAGKPAHIVDVRGDWATIGHHGWWRG